MRLDSAAKIHVGETLTKNVTEHNGKIIIEPDFVGYDLQLSRDSQDHDYNCVCVLCSARSARFYRLDQYQPFRLVPGETVRGEVKYFSSTNDTTQDNRKKIYIALHNARRMYQWKRVIDYGSQFRGNKDQPVLYLFLTCGSKTLREKKVRLTQEKKTVRHLGMLHDITMFFLPNGHLLEIVDYGGVSIESFLQKTRRDLGKLANVATLKRIAANIPEMENLDVHRLDRERLVQERKRLSYVGEKPPRLKWHK